jgi:hypothetical protein
MRGFFAPLRMTIVFGVRFFPFGYAQGQNDFVLAYDFSEAKKFKRRE